MPSSHPIPESSGITAGREFAWRGGNFLCLYRLRRGLHRRAEAKKPQRDMPIGILGSLVICTILYILVSGLLTGIVSYTALNVPDPVAVGIDQTGVRWGSFLVKLGAIAGLGSVMLVMLLGNRACSSPCRVTACSPNGRARCIIASGLPGFRASPSASSWRSSHRLSPSAFSANSSASAHCWRS